MGASTLLNGTLGFAMLLALLFCMPDDIESVLGSNTYYPFMNIYAYAVGSKGGASAMVSHFNVIERHAFGQIRWPGAQVSEELNPLVESIRCFHGFMHWQRTDIRHCVH